MYAQSIAAMAIPRCKLVERVKPCYASTYVVECSWRQPTQQSADEQVLWGYAFAKMALPKEKCGAVALVNVNYVARYLVLTFSECTVDKMKYKLKE